MKIIAFIVGVFAVALFLLCFQLKKREHIILCNIISRTLYIIQYCLLGEFIGAAMDISAIPSSAIASKKNHQFIARFKIPIIILVNVIIVAIGLALYKGVISLLPIAAVILETVALWFSREKVVRIVSLTAQPMWFTYNLLCGAYASAIGNALASVSIIIALLRYKNMDLHNKKMKGI